MTTTIECAARRPRAAQHARVQEARHVRRQRARLAVPLYILSLLSLSLFVWTACCRAMLASVGGSRRRRERRRVGFGNAEKKHARTASNIARTARYFPLPSLCHSLYATTCIDARLDGWTAGRRRRRARSRARRMPSKSQRRVCRPAHHTQNPTARAKSLPLDSISRACLLLN